MAQIKPMPVHVKEYYKAMRTAYTQKKEDALKELEELTRDCNALREDILSNKENYLKYNIDLLNIPEFTDNEYIDGSFLKLAKGAYINRNNDYELTSDLYNLLKLAKMQEKILDINKNLILYDKCLSIKCDDYVRYLREYFIVVHKKMILEGCAYHFGHGLGDVIINRVKLANKRKTLNYKGTKLKKAEILARGGRLYNKEEAEFCEKNGLEYDGEDGRVYCTNEYFYEVFMANRRFHNTHQYEFKPQDYIAAHLRGNTNESFIELCDRNLNRICELPVDLKLKLTLCNEVDKMLYTNFIRNENQTSYKYSAVSRKN